VPHTEAAITSFSSYIYLTFHPVQEGEKGEKKKKREARPGMNVSV